MLNDKYTPSQQVLDFLDDLINKSKDVNTLQRKTERNLLRCLFWVGEQLKYRGYPDDFIANIVPKQGIYIKLSPYMWTTSFNRMMTICKSFPLEFEPNDICIKMNAFLLEKKNNVDK